MGEAAAGLSYRLVQRNVRPPRGVTLVCSEGDWRADVQRMLECYSRTWGGDGNGLIACTADWEVAEPFWRLAEALDADRWAVFARTWRGVQMTEEAYKAQLAERVEQWAQQSRVTLEQAREVVEPEFLRGGSGARLVTPDALEERIRWRMAPLASAQVAVTAAYSADEPPSHGLVDMCELTYQPGRFTGTDLSGLPEAVQLLVAARACPVILMPVLV